MGGGGNGKGDPVLGGIGGRGSGGGMGSGPLVPRRGGAPEGGGGGAHVDEKGGGVDIVGWG